MPIRSLAAPFVLTTLLVLAACGGDEVTELELADGRTIEALVAGRDSVTLLLYDPGDCFSCDQQLADWLEWRHRAPDRVKLILTREPDAREQVALRLHRIRPDGTLSATWRYANIPHPARFFFVDGVARRPPG